MHEVLTLLAARAAASELTSLPLQSFDMEAQHEFAFRTLKSGLNLGKVVLRIAPTTITTPLSSAGGSMCCRSRLRFAFLRLGFAFLYLL